jgi:hypothetical protein
MTGRSDANPGHRANVPPPGTLPRGATSGHTPHPRGAILYLLAPLLALFTPSTVKCQDETVYKFTLAGIATNAEAKLFQHAMLERTDVAFCTFIEECACFKLGLPTAIGWQDLSALVSSAGQTITGPVLVSNGQMLNIGTEPTR